MITLNHDVLLETYLREGGIQFVDGIESNTDGVKSWSEDQFEQTSAKVRLLKLHGSVDWYLGELPERPAILVGTFNKVLLYHLDDLFFRIHHQFYRRLRQAQALVVCGYGFADPGINVRISEWMNSSQDHRMIVIHQDWETVVTPMLWRRETWGKRLKPIPKWIQDAKWPEIKGKLQ